MTYATVPAKVLFDGEGMRRDIVTGRKTGKAVTALTRISAGASGADDNDARAEHLIIDFQNGTVGEGVCQAVMSGPKGPSPNNAPYVMATGQGGAEISVGVSPTLTCNHEAPILFQGNASHTQSMNPGQISPTLDVGKAGGVIVFDPGQVTSKTNRSIPKPGIAHTLNAGGIAALFSPEIRRFTPLEYERLQGFTDNYTLVPYRGKMAKDTPRYKAVGNSMAVPVMRWIGQRIEMFNQ